MSNTAALNAVLNYLKEYASLSNTSVYKQIGLSANQGKARKDGKTPMETELLCSLGAKYPEIIPILDKYKIDCGESLDLAEFKRNTRKTIKEIESLLSTIKDQLDRHI